MGTLNSNKKKEYNKTVIYPDLNAKEYRKLSDRFLIIRKTIRKYKNCFKKDELKRLNLLCEEMVITLFLNTDSHKRMKQFRIKHIERIKRDSPSN